MKTLLTVLAIIVGLFSVNPAQAKHHHKHVRHHAHHHVHKHHVHKHHRHRRHVRRTVQTQQACTFFCSAEQVAPRVRHASMGHSLGGRPRAWCGWYMRMVTGITDPSLNLARNWARVGSNAGGPRVGAIVVWRHHVGRITGMASNGQWIVKSGNDGHAVRERPRSLAGAIAFRNV